MRKIKTFIGVVFGLCMIFTPSLFAQNDSAEHFIKLYYSSIYNDTSGIEELNDCYVYFKQNNDTLWQVRSLIGLSAKHATIGNYNKAFPHSWEALYYAEFLEDFNLQYLVHQQLGRLYNIFDKNDEAFLHECKTLHFVKKAVAEGTVKQQALISAYYNFVHFYRKVGEYDRALLYLDTCHMYADTINYTDEDCRYLYSEKGNILLHQGKPKEALDILLESEVTFERLQPGYLSIIYYYLGTTYEALEDWLNAELYYRKTLINIEERKTHFDAKAESLRRLAYTLSKQKRHEEAYTVLRESKVLNDALFSTKGFQNAGLLDIRNMYQEELKERDLIILERDKELINQKATNLRIRMIFIGLFAFLIISALFWYVHHQRKKFKTQKERQVTQARLDQEKNKALVELKNKKLTSFTLRLIDKDSLVNDLLASINKHAPTNDTLLKSVNLKTSGRPKLWEEFDKRFIDVNKGFYETLKARFPELTPTDLKHCALIKLNFSAKEMAQLLNISINGVNTSRYRIRKKMRLEREDNLTRFIGEV